MKETGRTKDLVLKHKAQAEKIAEKVGKDHSEALIESKENGRYHDTYYFEQELLKKVENGDIEGINRLISNVPELTAGDVAADSLRQAKNIFIITVSLITRSAISGGLDIETAYQLSDSYIREAEKSQDIYTIQSMSLSAILDFTKRVSDIKIPKGMSPEIFQCLQYISNKINSPICVEEIAKTLNMDRSTLSKKFKRELGFNISSYIMRRKLEEAKSLLTYTDKTISEISEYLCFSSQSYFQNVFKKKYGCTPKEYRKK